jgi:ankyrin repeat protein
VRAAERSSGDVIGALIDGGASVDVRDDTTTSVDETSGYTPLHAAGFHGNADAVRVLLDRGADPNALEGKFCATPAGWAEYAGHSDVRDMILAGPISPFQAIDFGLANRIPSIVRERQGHLERRFRDYGPCVGLTDQRPAPWHTPLWWAIRKGDTAAVRALLETGALQPLDPDGRTPLDAAVEAGHDEIADLLRKHRDPIATPQGLLRWFVRNACPDHTVRGGPSHVTARNTAGRLLRLHPEIVESGLVPALILGDVARVERILAADPNAVNERLAPKDWTPLLYLCFTRLPSHSDASDNAVEIARLLLDAGADPNAHFMAGDSRYTPMVGAIGEGEEERPPHPRRDELVRLLLERGAEPYDIQVAYNIHYHGNVLWFL